MSMDGKAFYIRLAASVAAVLVVLVTVKLLFFTRGGPPASDPSEPIVIGSADAAMHVGEYCVVEGRIVDSHNSGRACFLNFSPDFSNAFTAVIFADCFEKFPPDPEEFYLHKKVRVTGAIRKYQGRPEIVLEIAGQIEIVE